MIIKDKHPYLYINNLDLKTKAKNNSFMFDSLFEKAKADLNSPVLFPDDINGWLYSILDKTKERILRNCIIYKITKEQKYFDSMKIQLFNLIDKWPWIEKYHKKDLKLHADLRTGIIMYTLGLVYDWMYNDFTAAERLKVYEAITIKGYNLLKKDIKNNAFYLTSYSNNWLAVMLGSYCIAALATYYENDYSREIYELAIEKTSKMADTIGKDGAWEEGPFYWGGISFLAMFFDILSSINGAPNHLEMSCFKNTPLFPIYMNMPPYGRANFSDAHYNQDHNSIYILATIARITQNPYYQWAFLEYREVSKENKEYFNSMNINNANLQEETYQFLTYDETLLPKYPITFENFKVFQGANYGFISSRTNFGRNDTRSVLCINSGNNGTNHHQLDIGQLIITFHKENYIMDPGYGMAYYFSDGTKTNMENYFAKNSFGHNIVTIGNSNQINSSSASGKIIEAYRKDNTSFFTIDVTKAYRNVKKAIRKIIHRDDIIIVIDDFTLFVSDVAKLRWFFNGDLILHDKKFVISGLFSKCIGEVTTISKQNLISSTSYYSDEGCIDRANKPLTNKQYPYMQFSLEKSTHHVFQTTFTFIDK